MERLFYIILIISLFLLINCSPPDNKRSSTCYINRISYSGFTVQYNANNRQPDWVSYTLTAQQVYATENTPKIPHQFGPDPNLNLPQASNDDYKGSGWSRGHMARHQDMKWSVQAAHESDYYTNICPQNGEMNNGIWKRIENKARDMAKRYGSVTIVCGPVFTDTTNGTIGADRIPVPDFFFKAFLVSSNGQYHSIAFLCPNEATHMGIRTIACTVNRIEAVTGLNLYTFLDDKIEETVEDELIYSLWGLQ